MQNVQQISIQCYAFFQAISSTCACAPYAGTCPSDPFQSLSCPGRVVLLVYSRGLPARHATSCLCIAPLLLAQCCTWALSAWAMVPSLQNAQVRTGEPRLRQAQKSSGPYSKSYQLTTIYEQRSRVVSARCSRIFPVVNEDCSHTYQGEAAGRAVTEAWNARYRTCSPQGRDP